MSMIGYYLQVTPDQLEAIKSSRVVIDHATFMAAKKLTAAPSPSLLPAFALSVVVAVVVMAIWFFWVRHFSDGRLRWGAALILIAIALMTAWFGFGNNKPPPNLDVAQVSEPLDIDQSWHGIHFLLTGNTEKGDPPLFNVVLGGKEIGKDLGYGPARYLTPAEVKDVAAALEKITVETLRARVDPKVMKKAGIHCWNEDDAQDGGAYFVENYGQVRAYFQVAARKGHGMLLCVM